MGCIFSYPGPWISVLPSADHPDPTALLSAPASIGVGHRHKITPIFNIVPTKLPPKICLTLARPESVLFNWVVLIVVWPYERGLILFHRAKQEEMLRVLFSLSWEISCWLRGLHTMPGSSTKVSRLQALISHLPVGVLPHAAVGSSATATSQDEKDSFARWIYCTFLVTRGRLCPGSSLSCSPFNHCRVGTGSSPEG